METLTRIAQQRWVYWLGRTAFLVYAKLFHNLHIHGADKVPREGGLVVASNHFSILDPPMMGASVPREVNYMAKAELFEHRYKRLIYLGLRAFPVKRGRADTQAIKYALRRLTDGVAIGIFIQGTRNAGDAEALDGAAFLAQRAGVAVQPAAIWKEGRTYHVRFGEPIMPAGKGREEMRALTQAVMTGIQDLLPEKKAALREKPA